MAGPGSEKDIGVPDPVAVAYEYPDPDEPVQEEKEIAIANLQEDEDDNGSSSAEDREKTVQLARVKSAATDVSMTTDAPPPPVYQSKPWYKTPNPLRWGKIPQVPEERIPCPEAKAGFFSSLIFLWMAPLMHVSLNSSPPPWKSPASPAAHSPFPFSHPLSPFSLMCFVFCQAPFFRVTRKMGKRTAPYMPAKQFLFGRLDTSVPWSSTTYIP